MRNLLKKQGRPCRGCMLGCGFDLDALEHYGRCKVFWDFVTEPLGSGLGFPMAWRSAEAFLLVADMCEEDKVRMALAMYALYRTVQCHRHAAQGEHLDSRSLMKLWIRKAAMGSKASSLLGAPSG
eukprot:5651870-Karenia_brevis.AAC.1